MSQWPRTSLLELGALPTAVGCGRGHTENVLKEWGLGDLSEDAILVVSELLTNALEASWKLAGRPPVVLRLLANDTQLIIEAWDQWVEGFNLQATGDDEHGRGLTIVAALSNRWGSVRINDAYKAIWAELLIPA